MIIAANLKTNLTRKETNEYIAELENSLDDGVNQDIFVFPAMSSLDSHSAKVVVGAQNAYPTKNGAFTGEIGLDHLQEFDIKTILIGHSERRHILGESQEEIAKKFEYYKELGFKIVYCIGESLEIRKAGLDELLKYLDSQFEGIDVNYDNLIVAYEPVWAIGTGVTPTLEEIEETHKELKSKTSAPILYGGSVKVNNAKDVLSLKSVDGVLVGSAALKVEDFFSMIGDAQEIEDRV